MSNTSFTGNIKARRTLAEKEKDDFFLTKELIDSIDEHGGSYRDNKRISKFKINFELLNGKLDVKLYDDPTCFVVGNEEVKFDYQNVSHTPLIAQYANAIIGEVQSQPFKPSIKDQTPQRKSLIKKKSEKSLKGFINNSVVNPLREQIISNILTESNQTDIFQLGASPEAQLQLEGEVNKRLKVELTSDIMDFINGDVESPHAKQAQKMLNYLVDKFDIKHQQVKGFSNSVATGEEYYFAGDVAGKLTFERVNPIYVDWGGGDRENEWVQNADWVKRERWLSYQQLVSRHATHLTPKDLEIIDLEVEPVGGYTRGSQFWDKDKAHTKKKMYTYATDEGFREAFSDVNIKTKEGQQRLFNLYDVAFSRHGDTYGKNYSDYGIREAHIQWRDLRKFIVVKREMENGTERDFYLPEHYEPTYEDYDIREVWINQVWEAYKLGTYDCAYVGIRPIPYQYKSMFNPHDVDLSYYGKKYSTHDNTVNNVALVDLGKSAQKNFDIVLASIRHDISSNIGKVFTLFMNMKPEGWTWQEWIDLMRNSGILMMDPTRAMGGVDPQFLRQVDLTKMSDIANKMQLLEMYRQQCAMSMYFNPAREGQVSQYANATNVQQNTIAVHNKTAFFMEQHRLVVEKALQGFLNRARHYYRDHLEEAAIFLDDVSLALLQDAPISTYEWFGVKLHNSEEELQKLQQAKAQMLSFIQNGASPQSVMSLIFADTVSEVRDIINIETKKLEEIRQQNFQQQQAISQQEIQGKLQEKQLELNFKMEQLKVQTQSSERRAEIDQLKFQKANDVDNNKMADLLQNTLLQIQGKMQMQDKDHQFELEKAQLTEKIRTQTNKT